MLLSAGVVAEGSLDEHWPTISLLTQQVVDALQTSWQDDGRKIML